MSYLKNLKWEMLLFSLLSIAMGVLMILYPDKILTAICIVLASILFIMGIGHLIEYKRRDALWDFYRYELVAGIALIIGGIVVLICMKSILSIITYVIAIIIIVSGLMKVENALDLKKMNCHWVPLLVFAIVCILLGISVLMMPMNSNDDGSRTAGDFMVQSAGIIFAVTGLIDLITTLSVSGKIKRWTIERHAYEADTEIVDIDEYEELNDK
ncbi:MAG: HdeD family acid-resistance protein [Eubacterium sp.]